jgi:hypothetical protein
MRSILARSAGLLLLVALLAGCMVSFDRNPRNLDDRFSSQMEAIEAIVEDPPEEASRLRVWAYDPHEDILVKVSLPLGWLVVAGEFAADQAAREAAREARRQGGKLDLTELEVDLDALVESGPGAYVMVEDRDGRALVWIE